MRLMRRSTPLAFILISASLLVADEALEIGPVIGQRYSAIDSLAPGDETRADARSCLDGLCWQPSAFEIACVAPTADDTGDVLVRFPSPVPIGDELNDLVAMEWYAAKDADGHVIKAPTIVVIHESGSRMPIGRLFARGLRQRGLHTFMLQLPFYGERRKDRPRPQDARILKAFQQGIADARRARDAVAALPFVDKANISLQGISLGGFITATTAGLDQAYDHVFIMLAGGNIYDVLRNGQHDATKVRQRLEQVGLTDSEIRALADAVEPNRLAHRIDPKTTWLFSATHDTVVPPRNAKSFAEAARLDKQHHVQLYANHYSGVLYLPVVLDKIAKLATEE